MNAINTGKVLIGSAYVPRQHQPMSSCALTKRLASGAPLSIQDHAIRNCRCSC